jgi:hypothetical protein
MRALYFSWLDGLVAVCGLVLLLIAGWSVWRMFKTEPLPEPVQDPRRARLNQCLINLGIWAHRRVRGNHDVDTTLTMLDRKIAEIHAAVAPPNSARAREVFWESIQNKPALRQRDSGNGGYGV